MTYSDSFLMKINNYAEIILKRRSWLRFYDILAASNGTEKELALSLKYLLIKSVEEWVDDSQRAFPKVVFHYTSTCNFSMKRMNRTVLLSLLSRCQQILEDTGMDINGQQINMTVSSTAVSPLSSTSPASTTSNSRESYDNAYCYILIVMIFYSFLAMTLFKCLGSNEEKKDSYEEFMSTGQPSTQKFNTGHMAEKFDFEEESSL